MTFVQHSLKEFIRDERAWQRALDQPTDLNNAALTTNAHDTCWYLFHRGTTENARSLQFAERLRSSSLPRSCSRESSVRSSTASLQQKNVKKEFGQRSVATEEDETITVINMDESDENIARQRYEFERNKNKTSQNVVPNRFAEHLRWNKSMRLTDNERANMDILQRLFARNLQKHFSQQRVKLAKLKDRSNEIKSENDNNNKRESVKSKISSNENEQDNTTCAKSNNRRVREELVCTTKHRNVYQREKEQASQEEREKEVQEQEPSQSHHTWISNVVNVAKARGQAEENAESRQLSLSNMAIVKGYFGYYLRQLCQLESVQRSNVIFYERQKRHKYYKQFYETMCLLLSEDEYNTRHKLFSVYVQEHLMLMDVERESFALISGMAFDLFVAIANVERSEDEHRSSIILSEEQEMKKYAQLSYLYELNYVNEHLRKCTQRERKLKQNAQNIDQ